MKLSTIEKAKILRRKMNEPEQRLWYFLRDRRFLGVKFKRQKPIGPYIVDFVVMEYKLIIELDGKQHFDNQLYDKKRTLLLENLGFHVLRFWNNQILNEIQLVLEQIRVCLYERNDMTFNLSTTNKTVGSALIGVLMIITVLTLLVSTLLNTTILQTRLTQSHQNQVVTFNAADAILLKLEQEISTGSIPCEHEKVAMQNNFKMPSDACITKFYEANVNYFTENLGIAPCLRVIKKNTNSPAEFYRITVQGKSVDGKISTILQSTVAVASNQQTECEKATQIINEGRLSWIEM